MKRALAVLSAAIAVAACHVTVVPVPVRPVEHSTADAGHDRRPVVVVVDPRDSARIHREHRRDDADDSVAENGRTDHRPDWAAKPHDGGRTALPPGLEKHEDGPPGQARKDANADKGEHGNNGQAAEHGNSGQAAEHGNNGQAGEHGNNGKAGEHGNNGKAAEHGNNGQAAEHGNNGQAAEHGKAGATGQAEHGKAAEHGNAATEHGKTAEHGNGNAKAGNKSTEHGNGNAAHTDEAGPSDHGAKAQQGAQGGQSGQAERSGGKSGAAGKAAKADQARQVVTPERTDKGNKALPATRFAERSTPSTKPSDTNLGPDNKGKTAENAKADRTAKTDPAATSGHGATVERGTKVEQSVKAEQGGNADHGAKAKQSSKAEQSAAAERARTTGTAGAAPRRAPPQAPPAPTAAIPMATVPQLVGSNSLVGRQVRVTGTCVAARDQSAMGAAPTGRGDWQLVADRVAIWVAGPRPAGCTAAAGSARQVTLTATVAQDQLPGHGKKAGETRRYLVVR